jgi:MOSC domain-containing protein YiiM
MERIQLIRSQENNENKFKVLSVNISQIKKIRYKNQTITTGIFKESTMDTLKVRGVNIEGDDQADRSVHGGENKAIYVYPSEHYSYWKMQYPEKNLPFGMFGENLTTEGMIENEINVGDIFRIGTTEIIAVQPRMPCYKLGIKFDDPGVIRKFVNAPYPGIYFKIKKEGELKVGDEIKLIHKDQEKISVLDIYNILRRKAEIGLIKKSVSLRYLPNELKQVFREELIKYY